MLLFRGRKMNMIRGRNDSMSYNVAEMYLGVIIVAVLLCLLPTLAIFYFYVFLPVLLRLLPPLRAVL